MDRFAEVDDRYDPHAVEERVFAYWDDVDAYERTVAHRADGEPYFFVDGPPYTSGAAHMGTTWNKTLKDAYLRYLRMNGYAVTDRPGYDMHGLPIETKVEERLGFENKKDIEDFGIEAFIEECKDFADEQLDGLQEDFISFGVWMDWDDPYKTVNPEYMEAAWWGFKRADDRGLVERGKRSISQCPRCETAIAKNEVEYHQVEDPSIYVTFPLTDREGSLVIWTTTPWTIPGNTFVAVDPDLTYQAVRAERDGEEDVLWIAEPCVEEVLGKGRYTDFEVVDEVTGADMEGWAYEHPLRDEVPSHPSGNGALRVYPADYVEADRTGLVHSAPGHGEEDFARGTELGLDVFCPVREDGVYTEDAGEYAGAFVRDANPGIISDLRANDRLLAEETYVHDYGQCWRCDTDIIQIVTDQWFITVTDIKDELLENIEDSEWYPSWARDNRFRDFVEDAPDWNVSRQRYWGIPIPIWTPADVPPGEESEDRIVIGTREELADRVDQDIDPAAVDLHKPTVDDLTITADGTTYTRVPDVFDVWLDSSVATWGTLDYPEDDSRFDELWPADLILEAHDQTRGWFWSQLGMGSAALGEIPYERVLMHGHALDEDGRKMSKSVGNVIEPGEAIERHGRDVMRLFLLSATPQGDDMRFSWDEMGEMARRLNILWNTFRFPLPYMRLDGFDPDAVALDDCALDRIDRWVLSRLQAVTHDMTESMDAFRQDDALDALLGFVVEDVSRYYVQVVRERMWEEAESDAKTAAYATLYHVLRVVTVLLAPFAPFVAEEIYGHLTGDAGHPTVHMCDWPGVTEGLREPALEDQIETIREIETSAGAARQQAGRNLRWPVKRVIIDANDEKTVQQVREQTSLLKKRLNAKSIEIVNSEEDWEELKWFAQPDMSSLGPQYGDEATKIKEILENAGLENGTEEEFEEAVKDKTGIGVDLTEGFDYIPEGKPPQNVFSMGFIANDTGHEIYLDTTLTEEIESEGYAREVIRRVQEMRKDLDLDMDAGIRLDVEIEDERVAGLVQDRMELVREEVRAAEVGDVEDGHEAEWEVEGVGMRFVIEPLAGAAA